MLVGEFNFFGRKSFFTAIQSLLELPSWNIFIMAELPNLYFRILLVGSAFPLPLILLHFVRGRFSFFFRLHGVDNLEQCLVWGAAAGQLARF